MGGGGWGGGVESCELIVRELKPHRRVDFRFYDLHFTMKKSELNKWRGFCPAGSAEERGKNDQL